MFEFTDELQNKIIRLERRVAKLERLLMAVEKYDIGGIPIKGSWRAKVRAELSDAVVQGLPRGHPDK